MKRVLFFAPYGQWHYHGVYEITIGHALTHRDTETKFVTCDGLFPACDVYREGINPRTDASCRQCQQISATLYHDMRMPYEWLGGYVQRQARVAIDTWARNLSADELTSAVWKGHAVGEWARSSAFYQFRMSHFEMDEPRVQQGMRAHVIGTALAVEALSSLYDEWRPDVVVMLNGRFFSHWAAFALAQERGIRVVTHERGLTRSTLRFGDNTRIHDLQVFRDIWERWHDVPLSAAEIEKIHALLEDRRLGKNLPWLAYSPPPQEESAVRARLQLGDRPVLVLFSSSDDESAAFPDRRAGAFPNSLDWLPATRDLARRFPDHVVVLRMHPNLTASGVNQQTLDCVAAMARNLPTNCRIVLPDDDVSSYTLADMAVVGLVYFSTIGLEMACRGQVVVAVAQGWYGHCDFVDFVRTADRYEATVRAALQRGRRAATARAACRFAYHYYHDISVPFPLVIEKPRHMGKVTYSTTADLVPGRDESLDRICRLIVDGESLLPHPTATHRARTEQAEDAHLSTMMNSSWQQEPGAAPHRPGSSG